MPVADVTARVAGLTPDPAAEDTFQASVLNWEDRRHGQGQALLALHKALIALRRHPAFTSPARRARAAALEADRVLSLLLGDHPDDPALFCLFAFGQTPATVLLPGLLPPGRWALLLDSASPAWRGPGGLLPTVLDPAAPGLTLGPERFAVWERP